MPKKKGSPKTGGRSSGVPNRTTKEAKELLEKILFGQIDNINDALNNIRTKENESKYIEAVSKLFTYVLPRKADVTSDGEKIQFNITFGDYNQQEDRPLPETTEGNGSTSGQ